MGGCRIFVEHWRRVRETFVAFAADAPMGERRARGTKLFRTMFRNSGSDAKECNSIWLLGIEVYPFTLHEASPSLFSSE